MALSLAEVARVTRAKSRNGWAQYERGVHEPSPSKLQSMLDAVDSGLIVAVIPRTARVLPREDQTGMEELL
jgi:transcriptional regulator with XRE-family HTH domain